jgi:vitamin D3 24-hydroxylase
VAPAGITLIFTLEFISTHPEVMRKLRAEQANLGSDTAGGANALQAAPYLDAVIRESMRVEPTVLCAARMAIEPVEIRTADGPRRIAKGTGVFAYNKLMGTDLDVWPGHDDLRAFKPERWVDGSPIPGGTAHFPFGAGKHICPGARLALLQLKMMIIFFVCTSDIELARPMPRAVRLAIGPEDGAWLE